MITSTYFRVTLHVIEPQTILKFLEFEDESKARDFIRAFTVVPGKAYIRLYKVVDTSETQRLSI